MTFRFEARIQKNNDITANKAVIFIIVGILFAFASTYIRNNEFVDFIGGIVFGAGLTMVVIIICFCFKYLSLDKKSYNKK